MEIEEILLEKTAPAHSMRLENIFKAE